MGAVVFGVSFPALFFLLSSVDAMEVSTAFEVAKWSGLGLIGFYGFCAGRLSGLRWPRHSSRPGRLRRSVAF